MANGKLFISTYEENSMEIVEEGITLASSQVFYKRDSKQLLMVICDKYEFDVENGFFKSVYQISNKGTKVCYFDFS